MATKSNTSKGFPFGRKKNDDAAYVKAVPLNEEGAPDEVSQSDKIRGAAELAAGTALTIAGVPMLILPGPGALAIACGGTLALKGQRRMSGREATPIEQTIDQATDQLKQKAKDEANEFGNRVARSAAKTGERIKTEGTQAARDFVKDMPGSAVNAARKAPEAVAEAARKAPEVATTIAESAPKVASAVAQTAPKVASAVAQTAPEVAKTVTATASTIAKIVQSRKTN